MAFDLVEEQKFYLSQGVDYLGFLNAKLRDLRGWATLLNELVQNADDSEDATRITLDVTDEALVVENDGVFTDCGAITESRCGFDTVGDGRKICDFHAFRRVASGHKRLEEDTTGAFGIGFISVYQITDQPSLRSGKWFWRLRPEQEETRRIEATEQEVFAGTRFELPWAKTPTSLRISLGMEPVPSDVVDRMCAELARSLPLAAPFLKRLRHLELRRRGMTECIIICELDESANEILVDADGQMRVWKRLVADFSADAEKLRTRYGSSIESSRKTGVTVAVSTEGLPPEGRLYASLPTEDEIVLPVFINGDFFPSSDRKRILFDQGYQGEWNRAAIGAAARALANSLSELRDLLKPSDFWIILQAAKNLHGLADGGGMDDVFAAFWNEIAPLMPKSEFVFSSRNRWCTPVNIRLLQSAKEEAPVLPCLEELDLDIVHLDLQSFSNLLRDREVGVGYLTLGDLSNALLTVGLSRPIKLEHAPVWLRALDNRYQFGLEIERLLERTAKETKGVAAEKIRNCALVLTLDGLLAPPAQLRIADAATRDLFKELVKTAYWAANDNPEELLRLVDTFSVKDAIELLRNAGSEHLQHLATGTSWVAEVIAWFADNRAQIGHSTDLQKSLRSIPIWPSGERLCSLDELSVPGDFHDPLKLAKIIDPDISRTFRTFLTEDLHAQQLTLRTYLSEHVPRAFTTAPLPQVQTRKDLMQLMSEHAGVLVDDAHLAATLRELPFVECVDATFRAPDDVYFESEAVREILGNTVPIASLPAIARNAAIDLLKWLGVHEFPQANDVMRHIDLLTKNDPIPATRDAIRTLFKGLAENWEKMQDQHEGLQELREIRWLPGEGSNSWHTPNEIFASFQKVQFQSQAVFLDIPQPVQQKSPPLFKFLGVRDTPTVSHVVKHLDYMSSRGATLSAKAVYIFLNQNASAPEINALKGKKCLYMEDGTYADPAKAYWGNHPFGRYRIKLSTEWRQFQALLDRLGTKEEPGSGDVVAVLQEISADYVDNRALENLDYTTVLDCWSTLSRLHNDDDLSWVSGLAERKVIPNTDHFLRYPKEIFFEDRPGLVEKFDSVLRSYVIPRPEIAWRAMCAVGVKPLNSAVSIQVVECTDPAIDNEQTERFNQRWPLIRRVFANISSDPAVQDKVLSPPELWGSDGLVVIHRVLSLSGEPEDVTVLLSDDRSRLYFRRDRNNIEGAIARELAFGFFPDSTAGALAAAIKEVLLAANVEEARLGLTDLGFAEIDLAHQQVVDQRVIGLGGAVNDDEHILDSTIKGKSPLTEEEELPLDRPVENPVEKCGSTKRQLQKQRAMLRSYVSNVDPGDAKEMSEESKQHRIETDRNGIDRVLSYERQAKRDPETMPHDNEGYDIESRNDAGEIVRFIEVKSISGPWDGFGIGLSGPEFRMAQEKRELYWLYVVEQVSSVEPTLHTIQDPASKVVEFRFDEGWQVAAESAAAPQRRSLRDVLRNRLQSEESDEEETPVS